MTATAIPFTEAQRLKFRLLEAGLTITPEALALINERNRQRALSPADYASTSGIILRLEDGVWVNAPTNAHNPNFVDATPFTLGLDAEGLVIDGDGLTSRAAFWLPPKYHGQMAPDGTPWNSFVFTHGDRVRLAPIRGCAMACKFCNVPYEDRYATKPIDAMVAAVAHALNDPLQPARHVLISGGTPRSRDVAILREVYRRVLTAFQDVDVDIMMVPVTGLIDLNELQGLGLHELSINIEVNEPERARALMPQKYRQGIDHYLRFIAEAAGVLGPGRVRSMLMVGLEPLEETLAGVQAVIDAGATPVLSPFRPDPSTPLRAHPLLRADEMEEIYRQSSSLAHRFGTALGPDCPPCTHNTLTFVDPAVKVKRTDRPDPAMVE